jgi:hypothetical protein
MLEQSGAGNLYKRQYMTGATLAPRRRSTIFIKSADGEGLSFGITPPLKHKRNNF